MNRTAVLLLFFVSVGVIVWDQAVRDDSGATFQSYTVIGAIFALAFGLMLVMEKLLESKVIQLGSEALPPAKDIASVRVGEAVLPDAEKKVLLRALRKSKRAIVCGKVKKEIPFEIVDHWGGSWSLIAYEEVGGERGFTINRVAYAGKAARVVADCIGI